MEPADPYSDYSSYDEDSSTSVGGSTSDYDELAHQLQRQKKRIDIDLRVDSLERDWNSEYQTLLAKEDNYDKYKALSNLAQDFVYASKLYAQVIISELCLPDEKKTIKPKKIGGVAGGAKYVCQGILFKLALDSAGLYGSDSNAMKACGHDLKGLSAVHDTGIRDIHLPLICLIDYRGFRVVAMSLLPINGEKTIIYGSPNAGRTIFTTDERFNALVKKCAKALNLKAHYAGEVESQKIYTPVDIEGHKGTDGRYYLLDFARLMPPQVKIRKGPAKTYLFELLRPELVASNPVPLVRENQNGQCYLKSLSHYNLTLQSSDAGTPLGKFDPDQATHTEEITLASKRIFVDLIPKFADYLKQNCPSTISTTERVVEELHRFGINLRHLGFVRRLVVDPAIRKLLLTEMVARVLKDRIYELLRTKMREIKVASQQPYNQVVLDFLNEVFVINSSEFWQSGVKKLLEDKFLMGLSQQESGPLSSLRDLIDSHALVGRFQQISAITLRNDAVNVLLSGSSELVASDVKELGARTRVMNIVLHSDAYCVAIEASQRRGTESLRLYLRAHRLFQEVVAKSPRHPQAFYRWARMLHLMATQPFFETHSRRLLVDGAIRRLRRVLEWDPAFIPAHIELMDSCIDYLFNGPRLSGVHRRHLTETQILSEQSQHLSLISASMTVLQNSDVPIQADALARHIHTISGVADLDRFAAWLQLVLSAVPQYITPLLQRASKLREIHLNEACVISKDTIVFLVRNAADLASLSIRGSWDLDSTSLQTMMDYTPRLDTLIIDNCDKVDKLPPNLPTTLQRLEIMHTGINNAGLHNLAHHTLAVLTKLRIGGCRDLVNDTGLDAALQSVTPSLKWLHLGACHDLKWSTAFNYAIKQPAAFSSLFLERCSLSGCRDISSASVSILLNRSTNLKALSLAGAGQVDDQTFSLIARKCSSLDTLDISKTQISTESFKSIVMTCTNLTKLETHSCRNVHPSALATVLMNCKLLEELDASYWSDAEDTSEALRPLTTYRRPPRAQASLKNLNLCNMQRLDSDIACSILKENGKFLEVLDVSNNILLDDTFARTVATTCSRLQKLYLTNLMLLNDEAVVEIVRSNAATLRVLYLISCKNLTDASLIGLVACSELEKLDLYGLNKITNSGIQQLLQHHAKMRFLGLRQCKLVTSDFIHQKLRHSCPNLRIQLEGPKQLLLDLKL